ncbi:hypothetical protein QNH47_12115 [Virgibacillus halodenitrificans]|uniref:hypothetical protein n=1 Tax=Virgibacillus halodenitrificans TaxID=1482 RepID=UPI0024C073B9|nr:hypothetical protein [Virgibacillus halodenitrificans]WHX24929.1 hypothetical protein QNH47_12115 [Virgibacillus halodenitrificans]
MTEEVGLNSWEDDELPKVPHTEGFLYLYELLSHVTSSKQLFSHKLFVLLQLSRDINKTLFTRAEMEAMFPLYPKKIINSILNSLINSNWFIREEGSLHYSLSKPGLLFIRFLPFMYKGDEMDEMAFQFALNQIFKAAESMDLDMESTEFLRDQAMNGLQRCMDEIKTSIISKNPERILETSKKMNDFLEVIKEFINRIKELNDKKKLKGIPFNESDRSSINILLATKREIIDLLDIRKKYLIEATILGESVFTRQDVDRFLYKSTFSVLGNLVDQVAFVPSNAKWVDENDIVTSLNVFLSLKKKVKDRKISPRVKGYRSIEQDQGEQPYLHRVENDIASVLSETSEIPLHTFLFSQKTKEDAFMYLASICFLDEKALSNQYGIDSLSLDISSQTETYDNQVFSTLSKGVIKRRDHNE